MSDIVYRKSSLEEVYRRFKPVSLDDPLSFMLKLPIKEGKLRKRK